MNPQSLANIAWAWAGLPQLGLHHSGLEARLLLMDGPFMGKLAVESARNPMNVYK